jgi:hypothetical protein
MPCRILINNWIIPTITVPIPSLRIHLAIDDIIRRYKSSNLPIIIPCIIEIEVRLCIEFLTVELGSVLGVSFLYPCLAVGGRCAGLISKNFFFCVIMSLFFQLTFLSPIRRGDFFIPILS